MMKMEGRDSAENQIWEKRDTMVIKEFEFKSQKDKLMYSALLLKFKRSKNVNGKPELLQKRKWRKLEREGPPSL